MKNKRKRIHKAPPQITLGGKYGVKAWRMFVVPLIKSKKSTREIGRLLGVSHNTVAIWRRVYA